ncbi:YrdB family protein [Hanstruepera marina]|uniref:YrdB family protein n=1 Tax=Hanstruepera marina TaxID=2873265 RepID=UPI001CA664C2|nr:YrdB family protein [Hanstruepera marina]
MGSHPINLILRFLLEIVAILATGIWFWRLNDDWLGYLLAFGVPILVMVVWGVFAVSNDPSRSGKAPVPTNGVVRLLMELSVFGFAVWALYDMAWYNTALVFGAVTLFHYVISYDRVTWLLKA